MKSSKVYLNVKMLHVINVLNGDVTIHLFVCPEPQVGFSPPSKKTSLVQFCSWSNSPLSPIIIRFSKSTYCSHKCEGKSWGGDTDACSLRFDWDWLRLDWSQIQKLSDIASLSFDLQVYDIQSNDIKIIQLLKLAFLSVRLWEKTQHHLNVN